MKPSDSLGDDTLLATCCCDCGCCASPPVTPRRMGERTEVLA